MKMPWESISVPTGFQLDIVGVQSIPPYLRERIRTFAYLEHTRGNGLLFKEVLDELRRSFQNPFDPNNFPISPTNPDYALQNLFLEVIENLVDEWKDLIPSVLWNTLASMGTREAPKVEMSILEVADSLYHPWYICDGALHALGICYALLLHIESRLVAKTGHCVLHGCACNHFLQGLEKGSVDFTITDPKRKRVVAREFLDHFLGQTWLIIVGGYPFVMNPTSQNSPAVLTLTNTNPSR